jgi:FixJ family two-component response regulator
VVVVAGTPSGKPARVGIVDDDRGFRTALARLVRAVGHEPVLFESAEQCLDGLAENKAECLLVDLQLPGLDGIALQSELTARGFDLPIVFLTGFGDIPSTVEALKGGALDFLEKPVDENKLVAVLREAIARQSARGAEREELEQLRAAYDQVSAREREVLAEVIAGRLNKQIAGRLGITEGTVKTHRGQVMQKMRAASVAELVRMAARLGISPAE